MKALFHLLPVLCISALNSCVVPYPHRIKEREGIAGRVVDRTSSKAIAGAKVIAEYPYGIESRAVTRANGRFRINDGYQQHWLLFLAPIRVSWPGGGGAGYGISAGRVNTVTISKPGYKTFRKSSRLSTDPLDESSWVYELVPLH